MEVNIKWNIIHCFDDYLWNILLNTNEFYELWLLEYSINEIIDKNWVILDIWANIWNHSLYWALKWQKVISFEPDEETFKLLNINTSKYSNISIYNYALSDKIYLYKMKINKLNRWANTVVPWWLRETKIIDNIISDKVKLIKIDVEWMELEVLKWSEKTINKHHPDMIVEIKNKETIWYIKQLWYTKMYWIWKTWYYKYI